MPKGKRPKPLTPEETLAVISTITRDPTPGVRLPDRILTEAVKTYIGKPYGDRQCPVWLPQDPNVRHEDRKRCVRWGPHSQHSDTYLIEEQTLE